MSGQRYPAARPPGGLRRAHTVPGFPRGIPPRRCGTEQPARVSRFPEARRPPRKRRGEPPRERQRQKLGAGTGERKGREGRAGRTTVPPPVAPLPVSSSKDQSRAPHTIPAPVRVKLLPALDSRAGGRAGGRAGAATASRTHRFSVPSLLRRKDGSEARSSSLPSPGGRCVRFPRETAVVGNHHSPAAIPASVAPAR